MLRKADDMPGVIPIGTDAGRFESKSDSKD